MGVNREDVVLKFQTITKGFVSGINRATASVNKMKKNLSEFGQVMTLPIDNLKKAQKNTKAMNSAGAQLGFTMRKLIHGSRGFNIEMLGIMFFGMAISRVFNGLIRTSLQWAGTMTILSTALGLLFLPKALELNDWALNFLDIVGNLTEEQKKMIGNIALMGIGFGTLITIVGTLALGIGALLTVWSNLFAAGGLLSGLLPTLQGLIAGLGTSFFAFASVVAAIIFGMVVAWKEDFLDMKEVFSIWIESIKGGFFGLIEIFKGVMNIIKGILTGDFTLMLEGLKQLFTGFINFITNHFMVLISFMSMIFIGLARLIKGSFEITLELWKKIVESFVESWKTGIDQIKRFFTEMIPSWMVKLFKKGISVGGPLSIGKVMGFANGGVVPGPIGKPMPAIVHGGETVIPTGREMQGLLAPNISINVDKISSDYDVRKMAAEIKRYWITDFEKLSKRRGI